MKEILEDLLSIKGVFSCFVVDRDGELISSAVKRDVNENLISALVAEITNEIVNVMNIPSNFTISAISEKGYIFTISKKYFILTLVTDTEVNTGKVRLRLRRGAKLISEIL